MEKKANLLIVGNIPISVVTGKLQGSGAIGGGWIDSLISLICKTNRFVVSYAFPSTSVSTLYCDTVDGIDFYIIPAPKILGFINVINAAKITKQMTASVSELLDRVHPDILHVFGTEFAHAAEVIRQFAISERTILHVQGICFFLGEHYLDGIPFMAKHMVVPSTLATGTLNMQRKQFALKRAENEAVAMNGATHITGRTDWDQACVGLLSPNSQYHHIGETLRDTFYSGSWNYGSCEKHSIYISQASSTFKGFHYFVPALSLIKKKYPDCKVYVAGRNNISGTGVNAILRRSSYAWYLRKLIKKYELENDIAFLGPLSAEGVKEHLLKANVFVSSSIIENSPNSLGEAMILGVPCVASYVGGTSSMLVHETEGYLYQSNAIYMLAYYISKIFDMKEDAEKIGLAAKRHAEDIHDRIKITSQVFQLYDSVMLSKHS